jgi:hypothetical protein
MIYFVTDTLLKNTTNVGANADTRDFQPFIRTASDMWAQSLLGTYFYTDLLTKYNAQTLSANEQVLVGKIQMVVAWRAAADASYALSRKITNKGIQRESGENSEGVEASELSFAMRQYNQKAEFYTNRVIKYLQENKSLFANFTSENNRDSDIKATDTTHGNYESDFMFI